MYVHVQAASYASNSPDFCWGNPLRDQSHHDQLANRSNSQVWTIFDYFVRTSTAHWWPNVAALPLPHFRFSEIETIAHYVAVSLKGVRLHRKWNHSCRIVTRTRKKTKAPMTSLCLFGRRADGALRDGDGAVLCWAELRVASQNQCAATNEPVGHAHESW